MTAAKVVAHCDTCKRAFVHIGFNGISCAYPDCSGHMYYDDTPDGQAEKAEMDERIKSGRFTIEPQWLESAKFKDKQYEKMVRHAASASRLTT